MQKTIGLDIQYQQLTMLNQFGKMDMAHRLIRLAGSGTKTGKIMGAFQIGRCLLHQLDIKRGVFMSNLLIEYRRSKGVIEGNIAVASSNSRKARMKLSGHHLYPAHRDIIR